MGRSNCEATGDISLVITNGPYCLGESLIVPWEMGRFFPSSQTRCHWVYLLDSRAWAEVALFRAKMAMRQFFWNFAT
jgi:hypothetical protein